MCANLSPANQDRLAEYIYQRLDPCSDVPGEMVLRLMRDLLSFRESAAVCFHRYATRANHNEHERP